jgi:lipoprotein-releasing system ATP-binding protein
LARPAGEPALSARGVSKHYRGGDGRVLTVLDGVDFSIARGEAVSVIGRSGTGKSTLLQVLGGLDTPDAGEIHIGGLRLRGLAEEPLARLRSEKIGFVFQFHHLLREFTALENVMMPLRIAGTDEAEAKRRATALLERVGLGGRVHHRPGALSGGEQQRTAVARALAADPAVLLADEPSGNLDHHNSERLHELFTELAHELELGMVVVTHNRSLAARADRVLQLEDGRLSHVALPEVVA